MPRPRAPVPSSRPPLRVLATTLWEYPSQHYDSWINDQGELIKSAQIGATQGSKDYIGATPSWIIWQCLMRYTRANDTILDPMAGSGTTLDVCADLSRAGLGFDLAPSRNDIKHADARKLPLKNSSIDFVFLDPPYSTHVEYSDNPRCIGKLDAGGEDRGKAYYDAMGQVFVELHRVLRDRRYLAVYVSDSFKKSKGEGKQGGLFMPVGFELFALLRERFTPVDIITVVRHNQKLTQGNWRKAAEEGNFFLRGFNYLLLFRKLVEPPDGVPRGQARSQDGSRFAPARPGTHGQPATARPGRRIG